MAFYYYYYLCDDCQEPRTDLEPVVATGQGILAIACIGTPDTVMSILLPDPAPVPGPAPTLYLYLPLSLLSLLLSPGFWGLDLDLAAPVADIQLLLPVAPPVLARCSSGLKLLLTLNSQRCIRCTACESVPIP